MKIPTLTVLAFVPALASGCAGPDLDPGGVQIGGFPDHVQAPDRCGPASLHAVLRFHGREVEYAEVESRAYWPARRATSWPGLVAAARALGCVAEARRGDRAWLVACLERDRPPIVLYRSGSGTGTGHWAVVTGIDGRSIALSAFYVEYR